MDTNSTDGAVEKEYIANIHAFGSEETFLALLQESLVLEDVAAELWRGTQKLAFEMGLRQAVENRSAVVDEGTDPHHLNTKYIDAGAHSLAFGSLSMFYSGLTSVVGPPARKLHEAIKREHCGGADADAFFNVSNYGTKTTSRVEWHFVVLAEDGLAPCKSQLLRLGIPNGKVNLFVLTLASSHIFALQASITHRKSVC